MNEDRSRSAASSDEGPQRNWFDILSQALLREPKDRTELTRLLRDAQQRNLLDLDALTMIEGVLEVSEMQVRDVMIPRTQMAVININDTPEQFLPVIIESAHSRFPVIGDNRDEVLGILLAKDLLPYFAQKDQQEFTIRDQLRPAVFIPESKRLNVLLRDFRANRNHMAIVVDEYGGIAGLVTIEDVLEQIVGDIEDEHDFDEDTFIIKHSDKRYTVKALTPIEEFNEQFSVNFPEDEFNTVGGLLIQKFGRMPKRGEATTIEGFRFKVLRADSRRIYLLQVTRTEGKSKKKALANAAEQNIS
ncbi:MAG TPA: transporter associated domain-containing protein [Gammaproteobacteria bacterium]